MRGSGAAESIEFFVALSIFASLTCRANGFSASSVSALSCITDFVSRAVDTATALWGNTGIGHTDLSTGTASNGAGRCWFTVTSIADLTIRTCDELAAAGTEVIAKHSIVGTSLTGVGEWGPSVLVGGDLQETAVLGSGNWYIIGCGTIQIQGVGA